MAQTEIYLDYNATAPMLPVARQAVADHLLRAGNPSAVHWSGRRARKALEAARESVASLVDAPARAVIFTSGASEANVLALRGLSGAGGVPGRRVLVSAIEHDSVLTAIPDSIQLPVDESGCLNLAHLAQTIGAGDLVSIMAVNNETGVIQPLDQIADIVRHAGALLHIDAVQAVGRIPLSFRSLGPAALSLSAHKIGGPSGVGALVIDEALALETQTPGGGQERGRRGGTENLLGIVGFGAAADHVAEYWQADQARLAEMRDRLEMEIQTVAPSVTVIGRESDRVANTSCLSLPALSSDRQVIAMDLAGIAVSAGAACSSGKVKQSHVLTAMGLDTARAGSSLRLSLGWATTETEIDAAIAAYSAMAKRALDRSSTAQAPTAHAIGGSS